MSLLISAKAESDLDDIWLTTAVETGSHERADAQIDAIRRCFDLIGRYPFLGRHRPDLRAGLRSFAVGRYIVLYRVQSDIAIILHVLPGMRDIPALIR